MVNSLGETFDPYKLGQSKELFLYAHNSKGNQLARKVIFLFEEIVCEDVPGFTAFIIKTLSELVFQDYSAKAENTISRAMQIPTIF